MIIVNDTPLLFFFSDTWIQWHACTTVIMIQTIGYYYFPSEACWVLVIQKRDTSSEQCNDHCFHLMYMRHLKVVGKIGFCILIFPCNVDVRKVCHSKPNLCKFHLSLGILAQAYDMLRNLYKPLAYTRKGRTPV